MAFCCVTAYSDRLCGFGMLVYSGSLCWVDGCELEVICRLLMGLSRLGRCRCTGLDWELEFGLPVEGLSGRSLSDCDGVGAALLLLPLGVWVG